MLQGFRKSFELLSRLVRRNKKSLHIAAGDQVSIRGRSSLL
jgi:hypothetical protein